MAGEKIGSLFIPDSQSESDMAKQGGMFSSEKLQQFQAEANTDYADKKEVVTRLNTASKILAPILRALSYYPGLDNPDKLADHAQFLTETHHSMADELARQLGVDADQIRGYLNGPVGTLLSNRWINAAIDEKDPREEISSESLVSVALAIINGSPQTPEDMFSSMPKALEVHLSESSRRTALLARIEDLYSSLEGLAPRVFGNRSPEQVSEQLFTYCKQFADTLAKQMCDHHDIDPDSEVRTRTYQSFLRQLVLDSAVPAVDRFGLQCRRQLHQIKQTQDKEGWKRFCQECDNTQDSMVETRIKKHLDTTYLMYKDTVLNTESPRTRRPGAK